MPDLDSLLTPETATRAAEAAVPPPFEAIERRGRARRTSRAAVALVAVVAVVAGVAGVVALEDDGRVEPQPAVPTHTPSPTRTQKAGPTPEQIVDDPRAFVQQVVVMPEDPNARAVVWGLCSDARCRRQFSAIAVTSDGFRTRGVVSVRRNQSSSPNPPVPGARSFLVTGSTRPYLLRLDGSVQTIAPPGAQAARRPGEAVTRWYRGGQAGFVAVDTVTGASHYLPHPPGTESIEVTPEDGLEGIVRLETGARRVVWSDDAGASWEQHELVSDVADLFSNVPSAVPGLRAVIGGGDGATLFPFNVVWRGSAGGTWDVFVQHRDPGAAIGASAVLPDGRLVVDVIAWSDARAGKPGSRPRGPYVSAGDDWSRIERLVPGAGSGLGATERQRIADGELEVRGVSVGHEHATLYVGPIGYSDVVYSVENLGQTWRRIRVR